MRQSKQRGLSEEQERDLGFMKAEIKNSVKKELLKPQKTEEKDEWEEVENQQEK